MDFTWGLGFYKISNFRVIGGIREVLLFLTQCRLGKKGSAGTKLSVILPEQKAHKGQE